MTSTLSGLYRVCGFSLLALLTACNSDYQLLQPENSGLNEAETEGAVNVTIWAENDLSARIRRTDIGVPHIEAASLEEIAFGSGHAQAQDHLCLIADGIIKANSERSKYFGPHQAIDFTAGVVLAADNQNLISDFGYKALNIRASAEQNMAQLPARSTALLNGFVAGYMQALNSTRL
ncbi:MAG: penicillin acylase family protein [Ferrimonas sp.]